MLELSGEADQDHLEGRGRRWGGEKDEGFALSVCLEAICRCRTGW